MALQFFVASYSGNKFNRITDGVIDMNIPLTKAYDISAINGTDFWATRGGSADLVKYVNGSLEILPLSTGCVSAIDPISCWIAAGSQISKVTNGVIVSSVTVSGSNGYVCKVSNIDGNSCWFCFYGNAINGYIGIATNTTSTIIKTTDQPFFVENYKKDTCLWTNNLSTTDNYVYELKTNGDNRAISIPIKACSIANIDDNSFLISNETTVKKITNGVASDVISGFNGMYMGLSVVKKSIPTSKPPQAMTGGM